jgi:hypothetical protein
MEPVLLLNDDAFETANPALDRAQLEAILRWWLPTDEVHAADVLEQGESIESIGFRALLKSTGEVGDGARVGDHDRHAGLVQRDGQIDPVGTGRLDGDTDLAAQPAEELNQFPMTVCVVAETTLSERATLEGGGDDNLLTTDIHTSMNTQSKPPDACCRQPVPRP